MAKKNNRVHVTQEYNVMIPENQDSFFVTFNDWDFIKVKVKEIKTPPKALMFVANLFTGVCGSGIIALIALPEDIFNAHKNISAILWFVIVLSMIISVICYIIDGRLSKMEIDQTRTDIIKFMERTEKPYCEQPADE